MEQAKFRPRIVCIVGQTACHKTECAIELAKRIDGEIVSADSVQVYSGMDIGSAKPSMQERQGIPHHMIDCVPIDAAGFSVSEYRSLASAAIYGITARGRVPIVAGGSGLYCNALTYPLEFAIPRNDEMRARLLAEYDEDRQRVVKRLMAVDPETANRLHPNDRKRIVRALEVFECSGQSLSDFGNDFQNTAGEPAAFNALLFGLNMERERLYARINSRVDQMMQAGLLDEAKRIFDLQYSVELPAMRSIGYQQLFTYFRKECSLEEAVEKIKQDTRRFAKRQQTWFRRDERIYWYDVTDYDAIKTNVFADMTERAREFLKGTTTI
ncbi:MAG: tRNA (adenosine(37)-N6)-dimethylallyltransferase MiaA [Eubacteriales bacterium]|nr:tRNA (adenosine(37)-N6)-dimethylallyltransferase MiaA [Eubacteriales bacterium]